MTVLSDYIARMIEGGMQPDEAMQIAAELFAAGVASATVRTSTGALRTRKWRHKASQSVTCDGEGSVTKGVTKRHEASQSVTSDKTPLSISKNIKKVERQNRGSRISPDWSPTDAERSFAKQQGYSDFEVGREIDKFRDYWAACAGAKGVKLDWSATWRQWVRNGAERAGKAPTTPSAAPTGGGFYAKFGSEEQDAWDCHGKERRGRAYPRDKHGGWMYPAQWPPGYQPIANHDPPPPAPIVRAM